MARCKQPYLQRAVSQILTLYTTPVIYLFLDRLRTDKATAGTV